MTARKMLRRSQSGQGMTEYIIIVALIAIGAIGVVTLFGNNIRRLFGTSANALGGEESTDTGNKTADSRMMEKNVVNFADRNTAE